MLTFDLKKFNLKEIINYCGRTKNITCIGNFNNDNQIALIILYKKSFEHNSLEDFIKNINIDNIISENDIYYKYVINSNNLDKYDLTLIYPATQQHLEKYRKKEEKVFLDTYQNYIDNILPDFYKNKYPQSILWIENILNGKQENDKIIYQDNDFVLLPNFKWDTISIKDLYYLGILKFKDKNKPIRTLRDLNNSYIDSLENMLNKGKKIISEKHKIELNKILVYVHYYPSYFHFHVHYTLVNNEISRHGFPNNFFLSEIIQNIKIDSDYYKKVELEVVI
jgi:m7GpppX diphosphatase